MFKQGGTAFVAVITLILSLTFSAQGANNSSFTDEELLATSPFSKAAQEKTLADVVKLMNEDFNKDIKVPVIIISETVTEDQVEIIKAAELQGMPFWAFEKGINMYLIDLNIIILGKKMKLHNLAHEYAHYVQVMYDGHTRESFNEFLEYEAVSIQNNFRDR